jgi:phage tail-like protein
MTDLSSLLTSAVETLTGLELGGPVPATGTPATGQTPPVGSGTVPFKVSHVADYYQRYIGEPLTFFTRLDVMQAASGFTVQVRLPETLNPENYSASTNYEGGVPEVVHTSDGHYLAWQFAQAARAGERFEFQVQTTVPFTTEDMDLSSTAAVLMEAAGGESAAETVEVHVRAKGRYLKYLPALYYDDELMGRFLMLFESFWDPIEKQIDSIWYQFDPRMTPSDFLPWLATWSDLSFDERWTEAQQRRLLASAARLYRMRGTKQGLVEFLEIYTGQRAVITEHRANNLRLGKDAHFGQSVALGRSNQPHSFSVSLRLPAVPVTDGEDETVRQRKEQDRKRTIISIIEAEKPAHTTYSLFIEEDK